MYLQQNAATAMCLSAISASSEYNRSIRARYKLARKLASTNFIEKLAHEVVRVKTTISCLLLLCLNSRGSEMDIFIDE